MKVFKFNTNHRPVILKFDVHSEIPNKIRLIAKDKERKNSKYTDRFNTIFNNESFYIKLPNSPKVCEVIFLSMNNNDNFQILKVEKLPLKTKMNEESIKDPAINDFVIFSEYFSSIAGYLSTGIYYDESGKYKIKYLSAITDNNVKKNTPARINTDTGEVQVSKVDFKNYTIPGRFAILLHEFCHVFANNNISDEKEADYHAAIIYLSLGYPSVELLNVFANVFLRADTTLNRQRLNDLISFVMKFDSSVKTVKYK